MSQRGGGSFVDALVNVALDSYSIVILGHTCDCLYA
jgi:hypothetical protein